MAMAILGSRSATSTISMCPPYWWGSWELWEWIFLQLEINTPLQSHNLPCYQHVGWSAMQKLQLESMITTYQLSARSHSAVASVATIRSLSPSDIVIAQMDLPSAKTGLWSMRPAHSGLWCMTALHSSSGLWYMTALLSAHQSTQQHLRPTHAFRYSMTSMQMVSPPRCRLLT